MQKEADMVINKAIKEKKTNCWKMNGNQVMKILVKKMNLIDTTKLDKKFQNGQTN